MTPTTGHTGRPAARSADCVVARWRSAGARNRAPHCAGASRAMPSRAWTSTGSRCSTWASTSRRSTRTGTTRCGSTGCRPSTSEFGEDGSTFAGVRQTRLGVRGFTPTSMGELRTTFEFEMFGTGVDEGQTTFRLRHAYGELGQFGAGQYLEPVHGHRRVPELARVLGSNRHGLLPQRPGALDAHPGRHAPHDCARTAGRSGDAGVLADRIELQNVKGRSPLPDLTGEYRFGGSRGYVEVAGLLGKMKWDDVLDDEFDLSGSATRWGLNFSSNIKLGSRTTLRGATGVRRRHPELHERRAGRRRHRLATPATS